VSAAKPLKAIASTVAERMAGGRPSRFRSAVSAAVAGGAVAAGVYKGLRSQ
jgi:hypothetical protein